MTAQRQSQSHLCLGHSGRRHRHDLDPNFKEAKEERSPRMLTYLAEFNPVTLRPLRCITLHLLLQGQKPKVSFHTFKYFVHCVLQRETLGTPLARSSPEQRFLLVSRERTHVSPLSSVRLCPQVTGPGHWQLVTLQAVSFHLLPQRTRSPPLPVQSTVPVHTSSSFQCPPPSSVCMQFPEEVGVWEGPAR